MSVSLTSSLLNVNRPLDGDETNCRLYYVQALKMQSKICIS